MSDLESFSTVPSPFVIDQSLIINLITKLQLWPNLFRQLEEEYIASLVPIDADVIHSSKSDILGDIPLSEFLESRHWSESHLDSFLHIQYALDKFAQALFGPGLEDEFLSSNGGHDEVIYSLLRVKDPGLAMELWIRIEEGEATFASLAETYGQLPESARKGLFGPLAIGSVSPPDLASLLRNLSPGQVHSPVCWGEWHVLVRLERLHTTPFDDAVRKHLLSGQLNSLIESRVQKRLLGETPDPLQFDSL